MKPIGPVLATLTLCTVVSAAPAEEAKVAIAANFTAPMKEIAAAFERKTAHAAVLSFGSTGTLYAQIRHGAPFEVYLAADQKTPRRLVDEGQASQRFTYAIGKLVLWSADPALVDNRGQVLKSSSYEKLAIANPKTAPYGAAAVQVLNELGLYSTLNSRLVAGNNIAQAYQFVATRNANLGFVALSQVILRNSGSAWQVPQELYDPIRQDAVLLRKGENNVAATALLGFLRGVEARAIIQRYGYGVQ